MQYIALDPSGVRHVSKAAGYSTGVLPLSCIQYIWSQGTGENASAMAKGRAAAHKNAAFNALEGTVGEICGLSVEEFKKKLAELES